MKQTITEKILSRVGGQPNARAGDELIARPDFVIAYDFPGYTDVIFQQMREEFSIEKVDDPSRFALFIDHMVPAVTPKEEELHINTRTWGKEQGVKVYERLGIGHQVSVELGYATPGAFAVHFDGHISQLGAYGTLAIGVRRHLLEAFVKSGIQMKVPATQRVSFTGKLGKGVMARDVFHHMIREFGPSFARFQVLQFAGPAYYALPLEERQTMACLAMFSGAITAVADPDSIALAYTSGRSRIAIEPVTSDADAHYEGDRVLDVTAVEPVIVAPPSPANTKPLSEYKGLELEVGYLGSCASGRIEDLQVAADILRGKKIRDGFQLHVIPTSQAVMAEASRRGLLTDLIEAGAFVSSPSCDYCFGRQGVMTDGQRAISTGTLNVKGRMGSVNSEIYIASAATVAASAIEGKIADPRDYL